MATKTTTKKAATKKVATPRAKSTPSGTRMPREVAPSKGEAVIYSASGAKAGIIALPAALFDAQWNADLVHQVVTGMQANAREVTAHTKFRGEVSGGGKKPWKQKGTGRARHGSTRSPIWKGGGVTHGPRTEKIYAVKINKKMRVAALASMLSRKFKDGEIIFVDSFGFTTPKTNAAMKALSAIAKAADAGALMTKGKNAAIVTFATKDVNGEKSFRNVGNVVASEIRNLNPVDLATAKYLIIEKPAESLAILEARFAK